MCRGRACPACPGGWRGRAGPGRRSSRRGGRGKQRRVGVERDGAWGGSRSPRFPRPSPPTSPPPPPGRTTARTHPWSRPDGLLSRGDAASVRGASGVRVSLSLSLSPPDLPATSREAGPRALWAGPCPPPLPMPRPRLPGAGRSSWPWPPPAARPGPVPPGRSSALCSSDPAAPPCHVPLAFPPHPSELRASFPRPAASRLPPPASRPTRPRRPARLRPASRRGPPSSPVARRGPRELRVRVGGPAGPWGVGGGGGKEGVRSVWTRGEGPLCPASWGVGLGCRRHALALALAVGLGGGGGRWPAGARCGPVSRARGGEDRRPWPECGGRRRGGGRRLGLRVGGVRAVHASLARLALSRYLARPGAEV